PSTNAVEIGDAIERQVEHELAAAGRPLERLLGGGDGLAGANHSPQDVLETLACRGDCTVEALASGELAFSECHARRARTAKPHGLPPHRDARRQLRALIIGAESLPGREQPILEMAMGVQPRERRFGEIYRDAAPPPRGGPAP